MTEVVPEPALEFTSADVDALLAFLAGRRVTVLTGAGCSTESGIPDYRDASGQWRRKQPMTLQQFLGSEEARRRYWARSFLGWPRIAGARPCVAHRALAALQASGVVGPLVTQNVDGLHQRAGAPGTVIDLHGRLDRVRCLECGVRVDREAHQWELAGLNPAWSGPDSPMAPDGDADLDPSWAYRFRTPACSRCGGVLKPDVVFFGENVPRDRVAAAYDVVDGADAVLVVGSSLMVYSGYRLVRRATTAGKPVAAINLGRTRADELLSIKVQAPCGEVLRSLSAARH